MRPLFIAACVAALAAAAAAQPAGACDRTFRPACGTDGVTYSNPCLARAAGVAVTYIGPCGQPESPNKTAMAAEPAPAAAAAAAPAPAPPTPVAAACPLIYKPVCGSDGKTYSNGCLARAAAAGVAAVGECAGDRAVAGPAAGDAAFAPPMQQPAAKAAKPASAAATGDPGSSAALEGGGGGATVPPAKAAAPNAPASTAASPAAAAPRPRPVACTLIYKPVCGINGKTYGNECMAKAAQVGVAAPGECATGGPSDPDALEPEVVGGGGEMMMGAGGGGGMMGASAAPAPAAAVPPRRLPAIEEPGQEPSQRP